MLTSAVSRQILQFVGPGILSVFALSFVLIWYFDRKRRYVWLFSLAVLSYSLGAASQIFRVPHDLGHNAMVSALLYSLGAVALIEGLFRRSKRSLGPLSAMLMVAGIVLPIGFFYYVAPSLLARVYLLNFGIGAVLIFGMLGLTRLARGRTIERLAFWAVVAFAIHFFPRTVLSVGTGAPPAEGFGQSVFWITLQIVLPVLGTALALVLLALPLVDRMEELGQASATDPLTGLLNRRGLEEQATRLIAASDLQPVCLIACDVDHFKSINDSFGHPVGDAVLRRLGKILNQSVRAGDVVARLGGEEFVVLLAKCNTAGAAEFAERLGQAIADTDFPLPDRERRITASFGLTECRGGEALARLLHRADEALYRAKSEGRNRACIG